MRCRACQKKIAFRHYLATTRPNSNGGKIKMVLKCDCGFYVVPFDLVQIGNGKGLLSLHKVKYWKIEGEQIVDGKKLSREGQKIYSKEGIEGYEKWEREVFLPLMEEMGKKLRASFSK